MRNNSRLIYFRQAVGHRQRGNGRKVLSLDVNRGRQLLARAAGQREFQTGGAAEEKERLHSGVQCEVSNPHSTAQHRLMINVGLLKC